MNAVRRALSIVVPCYNEAANIPTLLARFRAAVANHGDIELVLVNNGSRDESSTVFARELSKSHYAFARLVDVPVNQGYGFGILSGLREARGEYLAWTHADLQTDPADVLAGYARLQCDANPRECLVRGRRIGRPWIDRAFTVGMGWVASAALGTPLYDINAQPKIFHRGLLDAMTDAPWDFSLDLYVLYLAQSRGLKVFDQPVEFGARQHGEAKGGGSLRGKIRLTRRTLRYIVALRQQLRAARAKPIPVNASVSAAEPRRRSA